MDLIKELETILDNLKKGQASEEDSKKLIEIANQILHNKKIVTYCEGNDPIFQKFPFLQI